MEFKNPTGKGGFGDHPENRANGRWSKENSYSYWLNYFKQLSVKDFIAYNETNPIDDRTMAQDMAYKRTQELHKTNDLKEFESNANRTEGMPKQAIELSQIEGITTKQDYFED
jgi:hypothetical protein